MRSFRLLAAVAAVACAAAQVPAQQPYDTVWQVVGGRVLLDFHESVLAARGLEVLDVVETGDEIVEGTLPMEGVPYTFLIGDADLVFVTRRAQDGEDHLLQYPMGKGSLEVLGGFVLASPSTSAAVDFTDFDLRPFDLVNDGFGPLPDPDYLFISTAADPLAGDLNLCYVKELFGPGTGYEPAGGDQDPPPVLQLSAFDLAVTETLARKLGRPELAGTFIGHGRVEADAWEFEGEPEFFRGQNPWTGLGERPPADRPAGGGDGGTIDVRLNALWNLTNFGRVGAFPNGRIGLSGSTQSCNNGDVVVPWISPGCCVGSQMNENHPGIVQQLYRISTQAGIERFEQIGTNWVKHGFAALAENFTDCAPCMDDPGTGQLSVGCGDTYGSFTNADRTWLGPRDEWDPAAGTWDSVGSWFDGTPAGDNVRDTSGFAPNAVDRRIDVLDADLDVPGATFVHEGMYLVEGESFKTDNIGWRPVTITLNGQGDDWNVSTPGANDAQTFGPAILDWGEQQDLGGDPGDGRVILAVDTTDLGGGAWRYEYALFNWDLDGQVDAFSVPAGVNARDVYFHDIDADATNDWDAVESDGALTWSLPGDWTPPPVSTSKHAGPIMFGELYNFGFTSDAAPAAGVATLGVFETGGTFDVATLGPAGVSPFTDLGGGKPGTGGLEPVLTGTGPLTGGSSNALDLADALPGTTTNLFFGLRNLSTPFKGGTLVPAPDVLVPGLPVDGTGASSLPFTWPIGVPAGTSVFFQHWVDDPGAGQGLSASNGLEGVAQ